MVKVGVLVVVITLFVTSACSIDVGSRRNSSEEAVLRGSAFQQILKGELTATETGPLKGSLTQTEHSGSLHGTFTQASTDTGVLHGISTQTSTNMGWLSGLLTSVETGSHTETITQTSTSTNTGSLTITSTQTSTSTGSLTSTSTSVNIQQALITIGDDACAALQKFPDRYQCPAFRSLVDVAVISCVTSLAGTTDMTKILACVIGSVPTNSLGTATNSGTEPSTTSVSIFIQKTCSNSRAGNTNYVFAEEITNPVIEVFSGAEFSSPVIAEIPLNTADLQATGDLTKQVQLNVPPSQLRENVAILCDKSKPASCNPGNASAFNDFAGGFDLGYVDSSASPDVAFLPILWDRADSAAGGIGGYKATNKNCAHWSSPLVLDLTGEGLKFSGPENGVIFDLNGDGHPVRTGWVASSNAAFLARDLNGNGKIDSGTELFGNATRLRNGQLATNGFEALKDLDANHDGYLDKNDSAWGSLRLWIDRNRNGITDPGELVTLEEMGIKSINLNYISMQEMDSAGNITEERSTFQFSDLLFGRIIDIWFSFEAIPSVRKSK